MKVKCISRIRNKNNQITEYQLQDQQGNVTIMKPEALKVAIRAQKIEIINLTLTSDNRLVATTPNLQQASRTKQVSKISSEEQKIRLLIEKAKVLGYQITEIPTYCKHKCAMISKDENNHILCIPDDVVRLNSNKSETLTFTQHIRELQGHIKVIGGHNLKDAHQMFHGCKVQLLDLSSFDTSNVENMGGMFCRCEAQPLDLSKFDTSNVTNMSCMFLGYKDQFLDLSSFDTSNVKYMNSMFCGCNVQSLDLSNFDTSNVTDVNHMFYECQAQSIDLSGFDTSNVTDMRFMFDGCKSKLTATDPRIIEKYNESR